MLHDRNNRGSGEANVREVLVGFGGVNYDAQGATEEVGWIGQTICWGASLAEGP
jgi:hypothetical protein